MRHPLALSVLPLALLALAAPLAPPLPAQDAGGARAATARADLTFDGIAWGTSADGVRARLGAEGYRLVGRDADGDLLFRGRHAGRVALVRAMLARGALAKVVVLLMPDDSTSRALYDSLRSALAARHGAPEPPEATDTVGDFSRDSASDTTAAAVPDDSSADRAASPARGAPVVRSTWRARAEEGDQFLALSITDDGAVRLSYESPAWRRESARRLAKRTVDL